MTSTIQEQITAKYTNDLSALSHALTLHYTK